MKWMKLFVILALGWSLACSAGGAGTGRSEIAPVTGMPQDATIQPQVREEGGITATPPALRLTPSPLPSVTIGGGLSPSELKYRILERFPDFFFCDPDFYPVARDDELARAKERLSEMQANAEVWNVLLRHHGLTEGTPLDDGQLLAIYRDYKRLQAIQLLVDGNVYRFRILTGSAGSYQGMAVSGHMDAEGKITIEKQEPAPLICPICLAFGTRIATPEGERAVETLQPGDLIWTLGKDGKKKVTVVRWIAQTAVPAGHHVVHLKLADGRELWASAGHPTADGRPLGTLKAGDRLDGSIVLLSEPVPYAFPFTYDLLPEGATLYWANGILLQSTLIPLPGLLPAEFPTDK
jgi:hypothetical protein